MNFQSWLTALMKNNCDFQLYNIGKDSWHINILHKKNEKDESTWERYEGDFNTIEEGIAWARSTLPRQLMEIPK